MKSTANLLILVAALALAGCNTLGAGGKVKPNLPLLEDQRALNPCPRGDAKAGEDARVAAKRKEGARRCEAARRAALAAYVTDLQKGLAGRGK